MIYGPFSSGVTTGGAGTSTNNNTTPLNINGLLAAVYVQYNDTPPATSDVTVVTLGTSPSAPALTLLAVSNAATSGWFFPRAVEHLNTDGSALTTHTYMPLADKVKVTLAQANDGDSVDVWLLVIN